ncbi:putative paraflagellar rod component par4 [Leishmania major strain Friedlin]|uniref:Putative paraflagellar rod component par4 n=1 Tax=Leishmania major TaxID=5664 RepID=Q4QJJ9_LEIMA|nr:putative paraflagellar rod component par4 [Leishmania major strain Friedlin]CAG9568182.1 paraflagellar_rod_component_par4_-_putative [Leishmania major strain Friedlin]CAJ01920.1 putative paraflagellar rod component par4 [Leishmania major strain Friedlin]|eukprot:XP_001687480.1 putative paraflagellar rod component par4 [Leishmania major strain Friedlin]
MAVKKGKGKKGTAAKAKADELRLIQLRTLEAEAEEFQRSENERRQHDEQEEHIAFLRDEQLRIMHQKDRRIDEVMQELTRVTSAMQDDKSSYESQIHQLSTLRDALLNEENLLKVEMEELHGILQQERGSHAAYVQQLRETLETERGLHQEERQHLRCQVCEATAGMEDSKRQLQLACELRESAEHEFKVKVRDLERELEKALTMNKALQDAVEGREIEDRKNVTLLQLLNVQLESDKRRYEEDLCEERERTSRTQEEVSNLEAKLKETQRELETFKEEARTARQLCVDELHECKLLTEQLKFDAKYLQSEMESMRAEHAAEVEKREATQGAMQAELQQCRVELEASQKKNDELEALLVCKEREHFDKVTFLNAQISNGRTAIAQLQGKMEKERVEHGNELQRHNDAIQQSMQELERINSAESAQARERHMYEQQLVTDLDTFKQTIRDLRTRMMAKDEAYEQLRELKEGEIERLRGILDAHFIPHRQNVEISRESSRVDELLLVSEQLRGLKKEMALKETAAEETERWLRARIAEQVEVIDSLQLDLKRTELSRNEGIRTLKDEVERLRKTLEVHCIPCL